MNDNSYWRDAKGRVYKVSGDAIRDVESEGLTRITRAEYRKALRSQGIRWLDAQDRHATGEQANEVESE